MKAMITFVSGQTMDVDIYYDGDKPVSIPQLERMYLTEYNRATPPDGVKLAKVKIFRTGSMRTPTEIKQQLDKLPAIRMDGKPLRRREEKPRNPWGDEVKRSLYDSSNKKKRSIKIW